MINIALYGGTLGTKYNLLSEASWNDFMFT